MNCIFCKIINNEIPCFKIYEDEFFLGFLDINPDVNGHTLLIPKKHILDINEMDKNTFSKMLIAIKSVKNILEEKLNIDGLTLVQNNGIIQEVKHFHVHLKPVYKCSLEKLQAEEIYNIIKDGK
ncbi:MAG: HIT domain-containing protein [Bacilli bacterium]|nr:HIT domain-containing protein [Bacilli bacterium]